MQPSFQFAQEIQAAKMKLQEQIHQNRMLTEQMEHNKVQLSDQVHQTRVLATEMESEKSRVHNLFGHKDAEIARLMPEVSSLQSENARLEERLAALSATPSAVYRAPEAPRMQSVDITAQLSPLIEAIQTLSHRMDSCENTPQMSHNTAAIQSGQPQVPSPSFGNAALPSSGLCLPIGPPGPPPGRKKVGMMMRRSWLPVLPHSVKKKKGFS